MIKSGVYAIVNTLNGKRYIGSSVDVRKRLRAHEVALHGNSHRNRHLQAAWNRDGEQHFRFEVIEPVDGTADALLAREQEYIDASWSNSYNIGLYAVNSFKGRKWSEEHRRKFLAKAVGRKISEDTKRKIGDANRGRTHSVERIAMLRASHVGTKASAATKAKMSATRLGKKLAPLSAERKDQISKQLKGRSLSDEHKRNIALAWARRKAQVA